MGLIGESWRIVESKFDSFDISQVYIMFSGGKDSIVPLHIFKDYDRVDGVIHIDTGIGIPQTRDFVKDVCDDYGLELLVYKATENTKADGTPDPKVYEEIVAKHGFPGPAQHSFMYRNLKERQVERFIREHKDGNKKIMLITGIRQNESKRRNQNARKYQRIGVQLWVAPLFDWTDDDMELYRKHYGLPVNEVAENIGMSGECLCGAYAKKGQLDKIRKFYPEVAEEIDSIKERSGCPWAWDEEPSKAQLKMMKEISSEVSMPLCTSCITKGKNY